MVAIWYALWFFAGLAFGADKIDVNVATLEELDTLPGIGPTKAAAIIAWRSDHGPFPSPEALEAVPGIGPATIANLLPLVVAGANAGAAPGDSTTPLVAAEAPASPAPPASNTGLVNINAADAVSLTNLPGIGDTKAAAIIDDRRANGPYASCADLDRVPGIGPATIAGLAGACTTQ